MLAVAAAVTLLGAVGAGVRTTAAPRDAFDSILRSDGFVLPANLQGPWSGTTHLVRVVTTDFDADGDLDVVASDGALRLFVWTNDGSGRLIPKEPRRDSGLRREPGTPSMASGRDGAIAAIQSGTTSIDPADGQPTLNPPRTPFQAAADVAAADAVPAPHGSPRAPPAA